MIAKCECSNPFQDGKYGRLNRVHNRCTGPDAGNNYGRCTVCSRVRAI